METPVTHRAKISIEIYTLAELLRHSPEDLFINNPTAWDCAVLPGLGFKPDLIWCFDEYQRLISLGKAEQLNLNVIKYALQLEIIEGSRKMHSMQRSISDEQREFEIRELFKSQRIPFGLLYVTIAHNRHIGAHAEDVFFTKPAQDEEYHILDLKQNAWIDRVIQVRDTLVKMAEDHSNDTICIGH